MKIKKLFWTRKQLIKVFAKELARIQMRADTWFYVSNNQEQSSYVLEKATEIKDLSTKIGICNEVYAEAYQIYDFRNSGKADFVPNMELLRSTY